MNDVHDTASDSDARQRWRLHWSYYIETSKRHSSSAVITAESFIKMAQISKGSRILDLGCGHGRITELLVEKVPALDVVGVDMTRPLLDRFTVTPGSNGSKIELICADITDLPLSDNSFDAVVSSRVFQYVPDQLAGVREAVRVLRPNGCLVISIPNKLNVIKYLTYDQKLYSPFEVRDWFEACGLNDIEYGSMCFFPSSARWKRLASSVEVAGKIPFIKYIGGNVLVRGRKKIQQKA